MKLPTYPSTRTTSLQVNNVILGWLPICTMRGVRIQAEQSRVGKRIARSELEAGDLVFFNTRRNALGHVGIYIGNNQFIHAANSRSGGCCG